MRERAGGCLLLSAFRQMASWVDMADGAIQDKARLSSFSLDNVKAADGNAFKPSLTCLLLSPWECCQPSLAALLKAQDPL